MSDHGRQEELDARVRRALRHLGIYPKNWVLPTPGVDHDVFIVGAGQSGLSLSFALRRAGVASHTLIDQAGEGQTGLWLTRARMNQMHTPKSAPGLDQDIPDLSFPAWYEALYGEKAYADLWRIKRVDWGHYVRWYQRILEIPVRYHTRLVEIERVEGHFRLHLVENGTRKVETARKILFCNGVQGTGTPQTPSLLAGLPAHLHAHTADHIPFDSLVGKSIGILGAGTSALDAAGTALEADAGEVHVFSRRPDMRFQGPDMPRSAVSPNYNYLIPDAVRWREFYFGLTRGPRPPLDALQRVTRFQNFHLHLNAPWRSVREEGGKARVEAADGTFHFDFVIAATGFQYDPRTRPELRNIAGYIALWRDRFQPPPDQVSETLGVFPYVGEAYQFLEKNPGEAPWIKDIYCYNKAAMINFAVPVSSMSGNKIAVSRILHSIVTDFFQIDLGRRPKPAAPPAPPENHWDEYAHSVWGSAAALRRPEAAEPEYEPTNRDNS